MTQSTKTICATIVTLGLAPLAARAQWPADPAANLVIADRTGGQTIPLVAATSDGGCYVGWFDPAAGSFDVYLQRLDADGVEQWPHNGILVSDHPQNTALFGWDLMADSNDNCVLVFSDQRNGGDLDIYAYKIAPDGQMLWGANGVTLSNNADFEPAPRVSEASNGDFVFVWSRLPDAADGTILMQRLTASGTPLLAAGGLAVVASPGEDPAFPQVVASAGGDVIVGYVRDISTFASPRHVRMARFDSAGALVWGPLAVFDAFSIPIGYAPVVQPDGGGGAIAVWHRSDGSFFNSFVQHVSAAGAEMFAHNGVAVSTTANMHHLDPALAYHPATGDMYLFWNERISNQSQWGIFAQRITPAGVRAWGSGGLALLPVNTVFKSSHRAVPVSDGAIVLLADEPLGNGDDRVIAMRLDSAGNQVWAGSPIEVSTAASQKSRLPVDALPNDGLVTVWEDDRAGNIDIYGQNLNADGSLGAVASPVDLDGNGLVNLTDYRLFYRCLAGPEVLSPPAGCSAATFDLADLTNDGDVDLGDYDAFAQEFAP